MDKITSSGFFRASLGGTQKRFRFIHRLEHFIFRAGIDYLPQQRIPLGQLLTQVIPFDYRRQRFAFGKFNSGSQPLNLAMIGVGV